MGTLVRWVSAILGISLLAALLAPAAGAQDPTPSRARTFAPAPSAFPTDEDASASAGPGARVLASGRFDWRAGALERDPAPAAPSQSLGFDAIPRIGGNWPADPTGALGASVFVTAVNTSLAVYDRAGAAILGPDPLGPLFPLPNGTQVFDPKVVYDQFGERFVLAFLAVNDARERSWIMLVVIPDATAGEIGTWCGAQIEGDRTAGDGKQFADYPGLGYDRDHVVVTTNQFDFGTGDYRGAQLISMRKGRLYDCDQALKVKTLAGDDTSNPDGSLAFTIQPATTVGAGNRLYLLSFQDGRPNFVVLWQLGQGLRGLELRNVALRVRAVSIGPYGTQGGGSLGRANTWWDPGDLRLTNAFADLSDSRVYGAHVVEGDLIPDQVTGGYDESVIRWYEIEVDENLEDSRIARIGTIGTAEVDVGWPAIATDVDGNVFVTYSRASQPLGEFLSAWVARIAPGRTSSVSLLLAAGSARVEAIPGPERWGGYAAVSRDPSDPTLIALVNQYAVSNGGAATTDWQQTVHVVSELP